MTQENKELLLKDICARLPCGVKVLYEEQIYKISEVSICNETISIYGERGYPIEVEIQKVKPYLFPLSSMNEEQKKEYYHIVNYISSDDTETWMEGEFIYVNTTQFTRLIHFYHRNHLDYRGLINGELALDANGLNIY